MARATQPKLFHDEESDRFDTSAALKRSLEYEFIAEVVPGTWKVSRKSDRFEFLARDETSRLQDDSESSTPLARVLDPTGLDLMRSVMRLFNHENLINLVDWIQVQTTCTANLSGPCLRQYMLWDFCNAGTLENLFMAKREMPESGLLRDQKQREYNAQINNSQNKTRKFPLQESSGFLPEAFCWHVICSILKALAWLHNGTREEWDCVENSWVIKRADIDWQTILHRNISPDNIFFCHPQTKFETYGLCKLGNFSDAFVSGVFNGILKDVLPPAQSQKVIAPQSGLNPPLAELRIQDGDFQDYPHPPTYNQPYTITSEYRALGDVIVAMMVPPMYHSEANVHWERLRTSDEIEWWKNLRNAPYTKVLKNFVVELMSKQEGSVDSCDPSSKPEDRTEMTFNLYRKARVLYDKFRTVKGEGKNIVKIEHVQIMQGNRDMEKQREHAEMERYREDLLYSLENSDRFTSEINPPTSLDLLLDEIDGVCEEVNNASHDIKYSPGLVG